MAKQRAEPPKIHIAVLMDWERSCASAVRGHESMVKALEQVAGACGATLHKVSGAELAGGFLTQWRPALLVLGGAAATGLALTGFGTRLAAPRRRTALAAVFVCVFLEAYDRRRDFGKFVFGRFSSP